LEKIPYFENDHWPSELAELVEKFKNPKINLRTKILKAMEGHIKVFHVLELNQNNHESNVKTRKVSRQLYDK